MDRGHPLAHLPAYVAHARARGRPTRLVLRNTERFGLVHLYFQDGRLARVEGHAGTPLNSIADLATWQFGDIRQDDVASAIDDIPHDPNLDSALAGVLKDLEARGVVRPAPPVRVGQKQARSSRPASAPSGPGARSASTAPSTPDALHVSGEALFDAGSDGEPPIPSAEGLPPLTGVVPPEGIGYAAARARESESEQITEPQWQLVALVVHQVLEQAVATIGGTMAEGLLRQSLSHAAKSHRVAGVIELDESGWLKASQSHAITRFTRYDVADAIAAVLTSFEMRCASLVGSDAAQRIVASAAGPFRTSLAQIGLDVSA